MTAADLKKLVRFGLIGMVGCLAGWLIGEPFLAVALPDATAESAPSLVSRSDAPPPPPEFDQRLRERGAKTGDVQISLIWNTLDDLDLHCLPPKPDQEIYFDRRIVRSGGMLDVDTNAGCERNVRADAVENIFWPVGKAPLGTYRVYVNYYSPCPKDAPPPKGGVEYKVSVLADGERQEFSGTVRFSQAEPASRRVLVHEFQIAPRVRLELPEKLRIVPGKMISVPFAVQRSNFNGSVRISPKNFPAGFAAETVELPADRSQGTITLQCGELTPDLKLTFEATASNLVARGEVPLERLPVSGWSWRLIVVIGIWTSFLAGGLTLALIVGQNLYLGRPMTSGAPLATLKATGAGFVSGALGQTLLFLFAYLGMKFLGFLLGWLLLGWLLGRGVSLFIPNLEARKAGFAGLLGGALGALVFIALSMLFEWLGRLSGAAVLGSAIGLMVAVVEVAFRQAWLEVRLGGRETITVNLGPEPIKIGSDAKSCTIFARGAAPIACRFWIRDGAILCQETGQKEVRVHDGEQRQAGSVTVVVHGGSGVAPADTPSAPTPPSAPIPSASPPARAQAPAAVPPTPAQPVSRPAVPPVPTITTPKAPPAAAKPPVPPVRPTPAAPPPPAAPSAPTPNTGENCPVCKRKAANRYCLVCDRSF
jgi:hypothetical protein